MANLVIVESPAKASTIKSYLGSNYKVVASKGHVRDLPKSTLGVDIENNFEEKAEVVSEMFNRLTQMIFSKDNLMINVTTDEKEYDKVIDKFSKFSKFVFNEVFVCAVEFT